MPRNLPGLHSSGTAAPSDPSTAQPLSQQIPSHQVIQDGHAEGWVSYVLQRLHRKGVFTDALSPSQPVTQNDTIQQLLLAAENALRAPNHVARHTLGPCLLCFPVPPCCQFHNTRPRPRHLATHLRDDDKVEHSAHCRQPLGIQATVQLAKHHRPATQEAGQDRGAGRPHPRASCIVRERPLRLALELLHVRLSDVGPAREEGSPLQAAADTVQACAQWVA
jgi:hypothetical protein